MTVTFLDHVGQKPLELVCRKRLEMFEEGLECYKPN